MRKLTMAALVSTLALSFGATATFAGTFESQRCNGGAPLGAEDRAVAASPRSQDVGGVNVYCLDGRDRRYSDDREVRRDGDNYYDRDGRRLISRDGNYYYYDGDGRRYESGRYSN
jgi:hypothetical protein